MSQYVFEYNGTTRLFPKDDSDKDKYVVFACAKNEDDYILEWVEHYLSLGFDKVFIADNNDSPESLNAILSKYINEGTVQIFECCRLEKFQLYIYNMFLNEANYKWCAYFDCDEFLELTTHKSIKELLDQVNEDCVLFNWVVFGSNGQIRKEDKPLKERFPVPVLPVPFFKENFYVKPILRGHPDGAYLINTHCPAGMSPMNIGGYDKVDYESHVYYPARYKYGYVRHYYTKSFNEWVGNKVKRGWPDEMAKILKIENFFIVDENPDFMDKRYVNGFFVDNNVFSPEKIHEEFDWVMDKYEMVHLFSTTKNVYSITLHLYSLMKNYKNHIFVLTDDFIDDAMYGQMLSYAMITGNRLAFAFNYEEKDSILLNKTTWSRNLYYYMDCK